MIGLETEIREAFIAYILGYSEDLHLGNNTRDLLQLQDVSDITAHINQLSTRDLRATGRKLMAHAF